MFNGIAAEFPFNNDDVFILRSDGPGSTPGIPLAFVKPADMTRRMLAKYGGM
jgi:hypothetical protein